jgi:hypothetical protein
VTPRLSRAALLFIGVITSALLLSSSVKAENIIVTEPTDFWFEYSEPTQFIAQTYMIDTHPSDPQLWLYSEDGVEIINNDDYNGLQSYISIEVQPGRYRLRAGTCCYQPDVWRDGVQWNIDYELAFNGAPSSATTTVAVLPTTTLPLATTTDPPQTTIQTTTTSSTTTTIEVPTTTLAPPTTTTSTLPPATTVPQTVAPTTTTVLPATTTSSTSTTTSTTTTTTTTTVPVTTTSTVTPIEIPPVVSPGQATELATDSEVLAEVTAEEATEIFEALVVEDLSEEQLVALVSAVQDAPVAVRESFEASVNVFGGAVDTYVPIGSTVPVSTRRTLIALSVISTLPAVVKRKW